MGSETQLDNEARSLVLHLFPQLHAAPISIMYCGPVRDWDPWFNMNPVADYQRQLDAMIDSGHDAEYIEAWAEALRSIEEKNRPQITHKLGYKPLTPEQGKGTRKQ